MVEETVLPVARTQGNAGQIERSIIGKQVAGDHTPLRGKLLSNANRGPAQGKAGGVWSHMVAPPFEELIRSTGSRLRQHLQADHRTPELFPGQAEVAILAGARLFANAGSQARDARAESLIVLDPQGAVPAI